MSNQLPFDIERLSFDSFERNPARDVVCLAPIRTMIRREEEITLVRRVRKVEEIEAPVACPTNTRIVTPGGVQENPPQDPQPCGHGEFNVYADAGVNIIQEYSHPINGRKDLSRQDFLRILQSRDLLPCIPPNTSSKPIAVEIQIEGRWTYGPKESEENRFDLEVGAEGNTQMIPKESGEGDLLFPNLPPAALVAFKITDSGEYSYLAHGSQLNGAKLTLQPNEKIYFICNDEPGFYFDNKSYLTVKWGILGFAQ
jgi:hypothetical protein